MDFGLFVGEEKNEEKDYGRQKDIVPYKAGWVDPIKIKLSSMFEN